MNILKMLWKMVLFTSFYIFNVETQSMTTNRLITTITPTVCPSSTNICKNGGICLIYNNLNKLCS